MLKAKRARTSNRRGEQQRGDALPGRREPKEALAAALRVWPLTGSSGDGDCSDESTYGKHCKGPRISTGECCCTSIGMPQEAECRNDLEWLEQYCGEDWEEQRRQLADECCYYDDVREDIEGASPPNKASHSACQQMLSGMEEECGNKREDKREQFRNNCCGRFDDLSDQEGDIPSGAYFPCDDEGGTGDGDQNQGNNTDYTDSGSPYKCGNTNEDSGGLWGKVIDGVFGLADDGMCALFNETCQEKGGKGKSVYCCRQTINNGAPSDWRKKQSSRSLQGALTQLGADSQSSCGPQNPPPDWVPDWMPSGYTSSQYLQALLLAALTGLSAFWILSALLGGDEDDSEPAQSRGGGVTINVGPQQAAQQQPTRKKPEQRAVPENTPKKGRERKRLTSRKPQPKALRKND